MNTTALGRWAEEMVAKHLEKDGYRILDKNWRNRWCEIDLIAQKNDTVYFIEVKYRVNDMHGEPVEFVTPAKLKQMAFASEQWILSNDWSEDVQLAVAPVIGEELKLGSLIFID